MTIAKKKKRRSERKASMVYGIGSEKQRHQRIISSIIETKKKRKS